MLICINEKRGVVYGPSEVKKRNENWRSSEWKYNAYTGSPPPNFLIIFFFGTESIIDRALKFESFIKNT